VLWRSLMAGPGSYAAMHENDREAKKCPDRNGRTVAGLSAKGSP